MMIKDLKQQCDLDFPVLVQIFLEKVVEYIKTRPARHKTKFDCFISSFCRLFVILDYFGMYGWDVIAKLDLFSVR